MAVRQLQALEKRVAKDFPILSIKVHGKRLAYLDNAATTQKPKQVLEAIDDYYAKHNANPHRGVYELSAQATQAYEDARAATAGFLGAKPNNLVFTRNATEAVNLVSYSWAAHNLSAGDTILLTHMEHHANLIPWQQVAKKLKLKLAFATLTTDFQLDLPEYERILEEENVGLAAFTHCSNVLGTINPVKQMAAKARKSGAVVLIDAAQSVPHFPVDFKSIGADFLVFSGHKMLGPMGIGGLLAKESMLESMPPFMTGGEMIRSVSWKTSTWNDVPWKFEAGTQNVGGAVGLEAAVKYLRKIGLGQILSHGSSLMKYALNELSAVEGFSSYCPPDPQKRVPILSFNLAGIHPHDLAAILDSSGVCIRAGHHCAMPLMGKLGVGSTARASFYLYNSTNDVDALVSSVLRAKRLFTQ
jgi:cysteine desulfurase/selenocysteine lyase